MAVRRGNALQLTYEEGMTYIYLGIIAARAGARFANWKTKRRIESKGGLSTNTLELTGWFANQFSEEEHARLKEFRDHLFKGICVVAEDGSITVFDKKKGTQKYTADYVKRMSLAFWKQGFDNTTIRMGSYTVEEGYCSDTDDGDGDTLRQCRRPAEKDGLCREHWSPGKAKLWRRR